MRIFRLRLEPVWGGGGRGSGCGLRAEYLQQLPLFTVRGM